MLFFKVEVFKLKKFFFYLTLKKYNFFFSCEHKVYILKGFKSYIEKIKYSSCIYIVNFEKD